MTAKKINYSSLFGVLIVALVAVRLFLVYLPISIFSHLVPPGVDPANHLVLIQSILDGSFKPDYPPLFHLLISILSKIFSADPLQVLKWVTPTLIILPSIGVYVFLRHNFNRLAAFIGFAIALLATNYGFLAYVEGNYPNIMAAGFFMPISLSYLLAATKQNGKRNFWLAALFFFLVIATHHLTAVLMLTIIYVYLSILTIWNYFEPLVPKIGRVLLSVTIVFLALGIIVYLTPFKKTFIQGYESYLSTGSVVLSPLFKVIMDLPEYADAMGEFSFFLGIISVLYLITMLFRPKSETNKPAIILLLVWLVVILLLSRTEVVGLPARIGREIAMPLLISSGIFIDDLIKNQRQIMSKCLALAFLGFMIYLNLSQFNAGVFRTPESFNGYVLLWPDDKEKIDNLNDITDPTDKVLANPLSPYLSYFSHDRIVLAQNHNLTRGGFLKAIETQEIDFIFIMHSVHPNPYEFWSDRNSTVAKLLQQYSKEFDYEIYHSFPDGSVIYKVEKSL